MLKVLIADDEPKIRNGLKKIIQSNCDEVQVVGEAKDGQEALNLAIRHQPDVIFVDINMPVMNGLELIEAMKYSMPQAIFIIISGYDEFEYAQTAVRLGVFEYLLKPLSRSQLLMTLERVKNVLGIESKQKRKPQEALSEAECTAIVRRVKEYIDENYYDQTLTLPKVAKLFQVSQSYISRLMKQELGTSFVEYVTKKRIEQAKILLSNQKSPIKMYDIAYMVGYKSQHYFSRVFKRTVGMAPVEYQQKKE